jgi:hypothetical protein
LMCSSLLFCSHLILVQGETKFSEHGNHMIGMRSI